MTKDLIIDVGMHTGNDSEFYLKKGFRVIGIEADPDLADKTAKRLSNYLVTRQLTILNVAIHTYDGETEFYINRSHSDWGTLSREFVIRNEVRFASKHEIIKVKCTRFENILNSYGIPYYLKIDIEGVDDLCLHALFTQKSRPKLISIEASLASFEDAFTQLALLWNLEYKKFKIINQSLNHQIKCPFPPREGIYVDHSFNGFSSGTFGEETRGSWINMETTIQEYRKILKLQSLYGGEGKYYGTWRYKAHKTYLKLTRQEPVGWYDFHAKE